MHKRLKKHSQPGGEYAGDVEVLFDRRVFDYMLQELSKDLSVEEGGKYVGYLLNAGDPLLERIRSGARRVIVIVDFLPSGPNAVRTAVELRPDGPHQEAVFRQIEGLDPAIEHVGTWHSHHCNGLQTLSPGDVDGYFRTVNRPAYRPTFFVASLVKNVPRRVEAQGWIDHYLFVRGDTQSYKITDQIRLVDLPSPFGVVTGHEARGPEVAQQVAPNREQEPRIGAPWFESEGGQGVLASDKRLFDGSFSSVRATRRDGQITLTGRTESRAVAVTYPRYAGDSEVSVTLKVEDAMVLRMQCSIPYRSLAYKAALAALKES